MRAMQLRPYQRDACVAAWDFLCSHAGNPVICLPTGSGKSLIIATLCREAMERFGGRTIVLAHRKELLTQNAEKIRVLAPNLSVGTFSAGLGSRDTDHDVVVAGVQSAFRKYEQFGRRHLVLIDEVHLVPHDGEGMYRKFLSGLQGVNPHLRMIGTTATPYRLDCGPLCRPDGLFQKVCYSAPINQLIASGWLCKLTSKPAKAAVDTSSLHLRGGEFVSHETQSLFSDEQIVHDACREIVACTHNRKSILVFCSGVHHAYMVAEMLEKITSQRVGIVTGESLPIERAGVLSDFRSGSLRWCVNVDVLTTGFDAPNIDCIAVLRATMSPGLFAQIVGRGFRIAPGKEDCLILDFGGNIKRHGPIDSPSYGVADRRQPSAGEAPIKMCPNCKCECLISSRECRDCGFIFVQLQAPSHDTQADSHEILSTPQTFMVELIEYSEHRKRNAPDAPPTMRVTYECQSDSDGDLSGETISEWICFEHRGYARRKAIAWWRSRSSVDVPNTVIDAVDLARRGAIAAAHHITAIKQGRFWRIVSAELDEQPEMVDTDELDPFAESDEIVSF